MTTKEIRPDEQPQDPHPEIKVQIADREEPAGKPYRAERGVLGNLNTISIHDRLPVT